MTPDLRANQLLQLKDAGLIDILDNYYFLFPGDQNNNCIITKYFDKTYDLTNSQTQWQLNAGSVLLTAAGMELVRIAGGNPDFDYHARVLELWKSLGIEVKALSD